MRFGLTCGVGRTRIPSLARIEIPSRHTRVAWCQSLVRIESPPRHDSTYESPPFRSWRAALREPPRDLESFARRLDAPILAPRRARLATVAFATRLRMLDRSLGPRSARVLAELAEGATSGVGGDAEEGDDERRRGQSSSRGTVDVEVRRERP